MTLESRDPLAGALDYAVGRIVGGEVTTRAGLERLKRDAATLFSLERYPSNSELLAALPLKAARNYEWLLRVHPRRSASGIVVVTAFSAPFSCPHGTCVFCPGGPRTGTPQSYLPESPGMRTALAVSFNPAEQVQRSISKYRGNGHPADKVECVIEGGTFIATPLDYQWAFVKGVFDGLNGTPSGTLEDSQATNESALSRCVGLTIESKPDYCRPQDIDLMLSYGVTRLEIGAQSFRDDVLKLSNRGHTVEDTAAAFQVARDAGLKVAAHMMPGLPSATPEEDLDDLRRLFEDPSFRPDMSKFYPTLVIPGTALARQFEAGLYHPYDVETAVELLSEMKRFVPRWHRIMRIQREIPPREISAGVKSGNLRQLVLERAREKNVSCRCIRCREVATKEAGEEGPGSLKYLESRYAASGGLEVFASYELEDLGLIAGFVRMRAVLASPHRSEMEGAAVVRELRVYGRALELGRREAGAWQHRGLGASLLTRMEKSAREEFGARRLLVTSAVGTRNYYRKLGYSRLGPYMSKDLT